MGELVRVGVSTPVYISFHTNSINFNQLFSMVNSEEIQIELSVLLDSR